MPDPRYTITADTPEDAARLQADIDWLCSDAANHLGDTLLDAAVRVRGKPVHFTTSRGIPSWFDCRDGKSEVNINFQQLETTLFDDGKGGAWAMDSRTMLAHELTHAGQREVNEELEGKIAAITADKELDLVVALHGRDGANQKMQGLGKIANIKDYESALAVVEDYVDTVSLPAQAGMQQALFADPEYQEYMRTIEAPAIANENKVARLLGHPERNMYTHPYVADPAAVRSALIAQLSEVFDLDTKLRANEQWQHYVATRAPKPGRGHDDR